MILVILCSVFAMYCAWDMYGLYRYLPLLNQQMAPPRQDPEMQQFMAAQAQFMQMMTQFINNQNNNQNNNNQNNPP